MQICSRDISHVICYCMFIHTYCLYACIYCIYIWSSTEFWTWKKGSTWTGKQLRRAGAVFFHNSILLIKMHTSKIGNTLYTEPFWKGRDVLQLNFHIYIYFNVRVGACGCMWVLLGIIICFLKGVTTFLLTCFHNSFGHGYSA